MTDLSLYVTRIRASRREVDALGGQARSAAIRDEDLKEEIRKLSSQVVFHDRAAVLLNSIGEEKQYKAQEAIEQLVTRGLQTIFDESLSFVIRQDVKAKRAEVTFIVRSDRADGTIIETDILSARGGGLAAVVGFLLRLVVLLLGAGAKEEHILVLDETFSHVSEEYLPSLKDFLRKIVDKTGVQILMVTHQNQFIEIADKVYRLSSTGDKTIVTEQV